MVQIAAPRVEKTGMSIVHGSGLPLRRAWVAVAAAVGLVGASALPASAVDNLPPVAVDDAVDATSGEARTLDPLNNDTDPEDGSLTITTVSDPANGTASANPARGEITYTSDPGYTGTDSFSYTIEDEFGATDTASINVEIFPCAPLGEAMDDSGIVIDEEWIRCSSYRAHEVANDVTPVMNPSGGEQAFFTTGDTENSLFPNNAEDAGTENDTSYRGAHDVSVLRLDLDIPAGMDCLAFDLSFQTEEYPEFIESQFNDGFLAELDVSNWDVQGASIDAPENFAFDGANNIVSVNSSFFEPDRVVTETGTEYDGSTPLLDARTPVTPGAHTLFLSIFDATDGAYDSGAYVDRLRAFDAADGKCFRGARQAPNAANDSLTVNEDSSNSVNVLTNDVDLDGDPIEVISGADGAYGDVSCTTDTCTYTPAPNYFGQDSFTYRVSDGTGADTGTVNVTVTGQEDPPTAVDDSLSSTEDTAGSKNVLANDVEPDGDPLTITGSTSGTSGDVSCTGSSCTYTPDEDFSGTDSFTYTVSDGKANVDTATVSVVISPRNDPPEAIGDSLGTTEDSPATSMVTANDDDVDGDVVSVTNKTDGADGSVSCGGDSCTYTPDADFFGTDSFTYTISDGKGGTDTATVEVSVGAVQDAPVADDDTLSTNEDTPKSVNVLAGDTDVDGDTLSISDKSDGANGTVSCSGSSCTYTPSPNFSGSDSFSYTVSDGQGGSDTATVGVTVSAVNDAPDATGDQLTTDEDTAGQVEVTSNDADVEGNALSVTSSTDGGDGSVSCSTDTCTYTPDPNFNGSDSFTYTVSDGNGGSDTASVTVTVSSVNDAPQATDDSASVVVNTAKVVAVRTNDSDVDGDTLSITDKTDGARGTVSCSTTDCTYTPENDYLGADSFTYTVSDGQGGTDTASVSVTVELPNIPPVAAIAPSEGLQVDEGGSIAFDGTDSTDSDGTVDSYAWTVSDGQTASGATPSITFGDNGTYDVTLEACDDDGDCDEAVVQVTVVNTNPSATIGSQTTTPLRINTNTTPSSQPGAQAQFTVDADDAAGSEDPLTYEWSFGDGTTSGPISSSSVSHAYKSLGRFTATVTVTDGDGGTVTVQAQPVTVLSTGQCGKLKNSYWGKPKMTVGVHARTQFWFVKGKKSNPIKGAFINPGQVVKLQPKPSAPAAFSWVCINKKRYMRVEKGTKSLPTLNNEYLPESALLKP